MTMDLHSFTAPYALDALDELERARFEAHLATCDDCREELAGFVATTGRIGESSHEAPPVLLRERLMAEIASTPQQRRPAAHRPGRLRRTVPRLAVAAAVLVGGFSAGGYVMEHQRVENLSAQNNAISASSDAMSAVLGAADADTTTKVFKDGGNMRMVSSISNDAAVVVAHGLTAPSDGKVYQLWMIDDSGPHSQGTFTTAGTMIMNGLGSADRIAVTVEPAGGSKQPSTPPIATLAV